MIVVNLVVNLMHIFKFSIHLFSITGQSFFYYKIDSLVSYAHRPARICTSLWMVLIWFLTNRISTIIRDTFRCGGCGIAQYVIFRKFPRNLVFTAHLPYLNIFRMISHKFSHPAYFRKNPIFVKGIILQENMILHGNLPSGAVEVGRFWYSELGHFEIVGTFWDRSCMTSD